MSSAKIPILFIGATGYIGGSVLARLLLHKDAVNFNITVLVRAPEKAKLFEAFGVKSVVGSLQDLDNLQLLSAQSHIVFQSADVDDLAGTNAILSGLKQRHTVTGDMPILIHTSGTGFLTDDAKGMYASDTIYSDIDLKQLDTISPDAPHHPTNLAVIQADTDGYARTYIISPSTIFGLASSPLVDAGLQNDHSLLIPRLLKLAIWKRQALMIGLGKHIWKSVHIEDTVDLYMILFDKIITGSPNVGHGREGIYFAENGEFTGYELCKAMGEALFERGLVPSAEPTTIPTQELIAIAGSETNANQVGGNSRCRADRARAIGWRPKKTTDDLFASIKPELEAVIKANHS